MVSGWEKVEGTGEELIKRENREEFFRNREWGMSGQGAKEMERLEG